MLVSWWHLFLGAQSLYRHGKTDAGLCGWFIKSRSWKCCLIGDERNGTWVYVGQDMCLSTSLEECPVSDLDLNTPAAADKLKQVAALQQISSDVYCVIDWEASVCRWDPTVSECHMLLYFCILWDCLCVMVFLIMRWGYRMSLSPFLCLCWCIKWEQCFGNCCLVML